MVPGADAARHRVPAKGVRPPPVGRACLGAIVQVPVEQEGLLNLLPERGDHSWRAV